MSSYKLGVNSQGNVYLEVTGIPTVEEKKEIDNLISPDGFIMAQVFKKLRVLREYVQDLSKPAEKKENKVEDFSGNSSLQGTPQPAKSTAKKPLGKCPKCNRSTLAERIVKNGKAENIGKTFLACINKECGYKDWNGLR